MVRCLLIVVLLLVACSPKPTPSRPPVSGPLASPMMMPGVRNPQAISGAEAKLADDEKIVGVVVGTKARAYRLKALANVTQHVVNDVIDEVPVTVTYCDRDGCLRGFTDNRRGEALGVSQLGYVDGLILRFEGESYRQKNGEALGNADKRLPLSDFKLVETTWQEWRAKHPMTDVVFGN